jgi:hypothetical protein
METGEVPFRAALVLLLVLGIGMALAGPARALPITDDANAKSTAWNGQRKVARHSLGGLYVALAVSDPELDEAVRVLTSEDNGATWSPLFRVPDTAEKTRADSLASTARTGWISPRQRFQGRTCRFSTPCRWKRDGARERRFQLPRATLDFPLRHSTAGIASM